MTHCRSTDFVERFAGSTAYQWYAEKDGVLISSTTTQIGGKVQVEIAGGLLATGTILIIYDNNGSAVATYELINC